MSMTESGDGLVRRADASDTGGVDIGHMGQLHGTLPGLNTLSALASDVAPVGAELWLRRRQQQKPGKDFNDDAVSNPAGSSQGQVIGD